MEHPEQMDGVEAAARSNPTKQLNRSAILRAIAGQDRASRITAAERTGLSRATVTRIVDELVQAGVVRIAGSFNSSVVGRKSEILEIDTAGGRILGVHLGGYANDIALSDLGGDLYAEAHLPLIDDQAIEQVLPRVYEAIDRLLDADRSPAPLVGIGIATGGDIDRENGRVLTHAQFGWRDVPLCEWVEARYGVHVALVNTWQGIAWSEALLAPDSREGSVLYANCSALIGAGFSPHHTIDHGLPGTAGQLGHTQFGESGEPCVCGKRGCLQAVASDGALVARALGAIPEMDGPGETPPRSIQRLGALALAGHPEAHDLFETRARVLAPAIALLANTLGPAVLVLGVSETAYAEHEQSRIAALIGAHLYPPLRPRVRIRPLSWPTAHGGVKGAIASVMRNFYSPALELRRATDGRLVPVIGRLSSAYDDISAANRDRDMDDAAD
jgi:predicted NBD/HSP70 family sugar kinase